MTLHAHWVSQSGVQQFGGFLNDYNDLQAHCVSHYVEPKFAQDHG